jgi:hypothetical protein
LKYVKDSRNGMTADARYCQANQLMSCFLFHSAIKSTIACHTS